MTEQESGINHDLESGQVPDTVDEVVKALLEKNPSKPCLFCME